jgi:L-2,4-diaminobutyrate decarboxylase
MTDPSFTADPTGLRLALDALLNAPDGAGSQVLPDTLPESGLGEVAAIESLTPIVLGGACRLGAPDAFAHMDPPTPWIAWATTQWNAALNQNLLHPDVAPIARGIEARVIDWLAPGFGMDGGHMTPGSTVANLTALWAARELCGVRTVIASEAAHLSIAKAAHLLGLAFHPISTDACGRLSQDRLPNDLGKCALVLTAGTTSAGAIDDLSLSGRAAWTHIDAAWAGPLRFSTRYGARLDGIQNANSVAVSAHKWLFQPKEAGLILFRDTEPAHQAVSFGGAYLAAPNVGLLGSHGAVAVPLLATLLAWGRAGLAERIDRAMGLAEDLRQRLDTHPGAAVFGPNVSGVVLWRPESGPSARDMLARLPAGSTSINRIDGVDWLRNVAANPCADIDLLWTGIERALA